MKMTTPPESGLAPFFDPLAHEGGSLLQDHAIDGETYHYKAEVVPADANVVAHRRTTPLFGLGLVDALPDDAIEDLANLEREIDPSTAGIVARAPQHFAARRGINAQRIIGIDTPFGDDGLVILVRRCGGEIGRRPIRFRSVGVN